MTDTFIPSLDHISDSNLGLEWLVSFKINMSSVNDLHDNECSSPVSARVKFLSTLKSTNVVHLDLVLS